MRNGARPVPLQVGTPRLDEGDGQLRGEHLELGEEGERGGDGGGDDALPEKLGARGEAEIAFLTTLM